MLAAEPKVHVHGLGGSDEQTVLLKYERTCTEYETAISASFTTRSRSKRSTAPQSTEYVLRLVIVNVKRDGRLSSGPRPRR